MGKLGWQEVKWLAWGRTTNKWQNQHEDLPSPRFNESLLSAQLQKRKSNTPVLKSSGHLTHYCSSTLYVPVLISMTLNISNCTVHRMAFCGFNAGTAVSRQGSTLDDVPYHRPRQAHSFLTGACCHFCCTRLFPRIGLLRGRYFAKRQLKRKNKWYNTVRAGEMHCLALVAAQNPEIRSQKVLHPQGWPQK